MDRLWVSFAGGGDRVFLQRECGAQEDRQGDSEVLGLSWSLCLDLFAHVSGTPSAGHWPASLWSHIPVRTHRWPLGQTCIYV